MTPAWRCRGLLSGQPGRLVSCLDPNPDVVEGPGLAGAGLVRVQRPPGPNGRCGCGSGMSFIRALISTCPEAAAPQGSSFPPRSPGSAARLTLAGADRTCSVGPEEHDLPDSSQYGDSSHPQRRMRAVQ